MSRILRLIYVIFVVVQGCERLLVWVARFGFLIYPLYGIVSWFMTSRKERVRKRAALVEALFPFLRRRQCHFLFGVSGTDRDRLLEVGRHVLLTEITHPFRVITR